jgi:hypothetical protein
MAAESYSSPARVGFATVKSNILAPVARTSSTACVKRFNPSFQFVRFENVGFKNMTWILCDRQEKGRNARSRK